MPYKLKTSSKTWQKQKPRLYWAGLEQYEVRKTF
jgi:hypothetical protein